MDRGLAACEAIVAQAREARFIGKAGKTERALKGLEAHARSADFVVSADESNVAMAKISQMHHRFAVAVFEFDRHIAGALFDLASVDSDDGNFAVKERLDCLGLVLGRHEQNAVDLAREHAAYGTNH